MWYWRQKTFKDLLQVAEAAQAVEAYYFYAQYCILLEQGLRKKAFQSLNTFLSLAASWPFEERKSFVDWIYILLLHSSSSMSLIPHPLYTRIIEPTLEEWMQREPQNPVPFRWKRTPESLRYAVSLSMEEEIARYFLIQTISQELHFAVHELPFGYCGNIEQDKLNLREMRRLLREIHNQEAREDFEKELDVLEPLINSYLEYVSRGCLMSFREWALLNNKPKALYELE
jgi:hypothetical protein